MFSSRTDWNLAPNRLAQRVAEMRVAGRELVDLTGSNPTRVGLGVLDESWLQPLAHADGIRYDPDPRGLLRAREAVAEYYTGRHVRVEPGRIFLSSGTSEAYSNLFRLLLNPGEGILVPTPSYPLFDLLGAINDVELIPYSLHHDGRWWIDVSGLEQSVTPACRAIMIVSPNNPTGSLLRPEERDELCRIAAAHELALISDEVFADFVLDPAQCPAPCMAAEDRVLSFTLGGLSKSLGLPQMKVAWTVVSGPDPVADEACRRLEVVADTYLSVNTPAQVALPQWLASAPVAQTAIMNRITANLAQCRSAVADAGTLLEPEGGWSVVLRVPSMRSDEEWCLLLLEQDGIVADPGTSYGFGGGAYLVLSLLTPEEEFRRGLHSLLARISASGQ